MSIASKLFGIWMFKRTVTSTTPLFMRLLLGMAALTVCAVVIAILGALLVVWLLWVAYEQLLAYDIPAQNAQLIVAGFVLMMFAGALTLAQSHWRNMRKVANSIVYLQSPISGKLSSITDAFIDGFNTPSAPRQTSKPKTSNVTPIKKYK